MLQYPIVVVARRRALCLRLPPLPIPLLPPDEDVTLDLGAALRAVYDEAAYELSIDYHLPPPPPALDEATGAWAQSLVEGQ